MLHLALSLHIYILRAKYSIDSALYAAEHEFTVVGGVDTSDILAFRELSPTIIKSSDGSGYRCFNGAPLYISSDFIEKHPSLIPTLVHGLLDEHEQIKEAPALVKSILATYPSAFTGEKLLEEKPKATKTELSSPTTKPDADTISTRKEYKKLPFCHTFSTKNPILNASVSETQATTETVTHEKEKVPM